MISFPLVLNPPNTALIPFPRGLQAIDTTWKWFTIPQEYKYISSSLRAMLEEKLQFLIKKRITEKKTS
jgi:hypothetical protein